MEYSSLYDMISLLQYGTRLHIGVLFLGEHGNDMLRMPHRQQIHAGAVCEELKKSDGGFRRCFRCRNMAINKAITTKEAFGGYCINGVYEYTHPVVIDGEVVCIIYIGNILENECGYGKIRERLVDKEHLLSTMEKDYDYNKCEAAGKLIESYIRMLLQSNNENKSDKLNNVIENIKSYVDMNLEFDTNISHIAQMFHYNAKYLGRLFKKETKMTFADYVSLQRLERAKQLLKGNKSSVLTVSEKVGFNNVTYFNRLFKRTYGMTPSEYRTLGK
ncbi:MAG: helix-turn-helix domain-containing protein [Clostridia bacterium]|nr:helix-turn-helix domain-containing protein [Clostridia bacterium]